LKGGETRTMRRMEQTGRFRLEVIPDLEHTLFEHSTREEAVRLLSDHVVGKFSAPTALR
jgi:hypothetical protein